MGNKNQYVDLFLSNFNSFTGFKEDSIETFFTPLCLELIIINDPMYRFQEVDSAFKSFNSSLGFEFLPPQTTTYNYFQCLNEKLRKLRDDVKYIVTQSNFDVDRYKDRPFMRENQLSFAQNVLAKATFICNDAFLMSQFNQYLARQIGVNIAHDSLSTALNKYCEYLKCGIGKSTSIPAYFNKLHNTNIFTPKYFNM